jgi:hypothetical protein
MKKSIVIILYISIVSILQSCQIDYYTSKNINLGKLIENGHFILNKLILVNNLEFCISKAFAKKFKNLNFLTENELKLDLSIQSQINSDDDNFTIIRPKLPIYFFIYIMGFLFYILGGIICLIVILKNEFKNPIDKIAWVITIIFTPIIGIFLFIFLGRKQLKAENK